jgi:hypothetical protein
VGGCPERRLECGKARCLGKAQQFRVPEHGRRKGWRGVGSCQALESAKLGVWTLLCKPPGDFRVGSGV